MTLSFSKYFDHGIGLECTLINDGGAEPFFRPFSDQLVAQQIVHIASTPPLPGAQTITVDTYQDIALARQITKLLFETVVGKTLALDCVAGFNNKVLPVDVPWITGMRRLS